MTPLRIHPEAAIERLRAIRRMRDGEAAVRFDRALERIFDGIEEAPDQFAEHGLLVVRNGRTMLSANRGPPSA